MKQTEAVQLAKIHAKQDTRRAILGVAASAAANPLTVGLAALAVNYAAYKAGVYKGAPTRSALGGPVWWTIGNPPSPEVEQYARIDLFIVTATLALAVSGGIKGLASPLKSVNDLIGGVAS